MPRNVDIPALEGEKAHFESLCLSVQLRMSSSLCFTEERSTQIYQLFQFHETSFVDIELKFIF